MASGSGQWDVPEESLRIAHPQKIYLKFSTSETSVEEYLVDLSKTGMFVRCSDPPSPGTLFEFKMHLASGEPPTGGEAVVVWVREQQHKLSHPRGMGVRFTKLDPASREQIRATVERYSRTVGDPGELQNLRSVVEETLGDVLPQEKTPEPASQRAVSPDQETGTTLDDDPSDDDPTDDDISSAFLPLEEQAFAPKAAASVQKKQFRSPEPPSSRAAVAKAVPPAQRRKPLLEGSPQPPVTAAAGVRWGLIGVAVLVLAALATGWAWFEARYGARPPEDRAAVTEAGARTTEARQEAGPDPEALAAAAPTDPGLSDPTSGDPTSDDPSLGQASEGVSTSSALAVDDPEESPPDAEESTPAEDADQQEQDPEARVLENLNGWAKSWARQDADAYLDFYSSFFRPPQGQARIAWRRTRKERIEAPQRIELEIREVQTEALSETRYRVVFEQTYRSESFEDTVTKMLEWVQEDGDWKILKEEAGG